MVSRDMFDLLRPRGRPHKTNQSAGSRAARGGGLERTDARLLVGAAVPLSTDSTLTISPASTGLWHSSVETAIARFGSLLDGTLSILAGEILLSPWADRSGVRG